MVLRTERSEEVTDVLTIIDGMQRHADAFGASVMDMAEYFVDRFFVDDPARGEQPDEAIHSFPGALRGDVPPSSITDKEAK